MIVIQIWIAVHILRIFTPTNATVLSGEHISNTSDAISRDVKLLTTIRAKHFTYKTNIVYFTDRSRPLLELLDCGTDTRRMTIKLNENELPVVKPQANCSQLIEISLDPANTTKTYSCLRGARINYNKFTLPLPGPSQFSQDCRQIMLVEKFQDVADKLTNILIKHPNLIKIIYAFNDCGLNEVELFKYFNFLWVINRILFVQYISHCDNEPVAHTQIYNFTPFARYKTRNMDVFGAITRVNFNGGIVVDVTFRNFNGYLFDVVFFVTTMAFLKSTLNLVTLKRSVPHKSYEYEIRDLDSFYGVDGTVLQVLMEINNFTVKTIPNLDGAYYGFRNENGTFNGGLADIIYKRGEFIANGYFVKDYESRLIEFSHAVLSEKLCLVVKTADLVPSSLILIRCFSPKVWMSMVATMIVVGGTYAVLMQKSRRLFETEIKSKSLEATRNVRFNRNRKGHAFKFISKNFGMMFQVMGLLLSAPIGSIGYMQHERIFLTACFLWSLNISGAFQGSLVDVYTTPTSYPDIDTLHQLDKSNYPIAARHPGLIVDVFGVEKRGSTLGNLRSKLYPTEDNQLAEKIANKGKLANLERLTDFGIRSAEHMRNDGVSYLHMVRECPRGYYLSYLFPKSSIFLETINQDLNRLLQSGLIAKWERDTFYLQKFAAALDHRHFFKESRITLTLSHLQVAFFILSLGMVFSTIVFGMEVYWKTKKFGKQR